MIPPDVASSLRQLLPDQQSPHAQTQPVAPAARLADVLSNLVPGQRIMAEIQALLPNGTYRAIVAQRDLTLALPFSAKPGDTLELEVTENDGKLTLAALTSRAPGQASSPHQDSVAATLSQTGKLIGELLGDIDNQGRRVPPAPLNGSQPLVTAMPKDAGDLAPVLKQALTQSGMFYEAHQARWVAGELPTARLLQEPQGQHSQLRAPSSEPPSQPMAHPARLPAMAIGSPPPAAWAVAPPQAGNHGSPDAAADLGRPSPSANGSPPPPAGALPPASSPRPAQSAGDSSSPPAAADLVRPPLSAGGTQSPEPETFQPTSLPQAPQPAGDSRSPQTAAYLAQLPLPAGAPLPPEPEALPAATLPQASLPAEYSKSPLTPTDLGRQPLPAGASPPAQEAEAPPPPSLPQAPPLAENSKSPPGAINLARLPLPAGASQPPEPEAPPPPSLPPAPPLAENSKSPPGAIDLARLPLPAGASRPPEPEAPPPPSLPSAPPLAGDSEAPPAANLVRPQLPAGGSPPLEPNAPPPPGNAEASRTTRSETSRATAPLPVVEAKRAFDTTFHAPVQPGTAASIPADLTPLVQQQLDALASQTFAWQGQIWPGQHMHWEIEQQANARGNQGDDQSGSRWRTLLKMTLPQLGEIEATLSLQPGGQIGIALTTGSSISEARLDAAASQLGKQLAASGLALTQFSVKHGEASE